VIFEGVGESAAQLLGMLRKLQDKRALNIGAAMPPAREFEMSLADGAHVFQELENVVARHRAPPGAGSDEQRRQPVAVA
jgi:hypothetical protein